MERLLRELRPESPAFVKVPSGRSGATPRHVARPPHRPRTMPLGGAGSTTGSRPAIRSLPSPLGAWGRVVLGLLLAGAWAGKASWRRRMGLAHTLAILILLGGAAVAVRPLLPHVYAAAETDWQCTPQESVQPATPWDADS